jgi:FkbM family methyltransferase
MNVDETDFEEVPISLLCFGHYELEETNIVLKVLGMIKKDNKVVLDIGANLGWYSLNILKKFTKSEVYSFEPSKETFERLKNNFSLNNLLTDKLQNVGLYNEDGSIDFYYDKAGSGASSMKNIRERNTVEKISVPVKKLDNWCKEKNIKEIDFIKCDVEGAELFVYQGGKDTIEKYKPIIFSEMLRKWSAKFGYHPNDIIKFMKDIGYNCYVIYNDKLKEINEVTEETVETNYFFLNRQKHADIIEKLLYKE